MQKWGEFRGLSDLGENLSLPGCWRATCVCHTQIVQCMCLSADISFPQQVLTSEDVGYCVSLVYLVYHSMSTFADRDSGILGRIHRDV